MVYLLSMRYSGGGDEIVFLKARADGKMDLELAFACIRENFEYANWWGGGKHVLVKMPLTSYFVRMVVVILQHTSMQQRGWTLQWN